MLAIQIEHHLQEAVQSLFPDADTRLIQVRPCADPRHGDYQTNGLIGLAKSRRTNPRTLAQQVLDRLNLESICESVTIAGPGFLNFTLSTNAIASVLNAAVRREHLFFGAASKPQTVIVDFSSPNVAKSMHIGHIRSTILGDCLARVLRLLGHRVVTDNHLGDWGTQFGKLILGWKRDRDEEALKSDPLPELERLYKKIHARCEQDPETLAEARRELVELQNGNEENRAIWETMIAISRAEFDAVYERLGVGFDETLGESFYNSQLKPVVDELVRAGIARESEGAIVVFFDETPDLQPHPALIQKRDGAANYTTTDLATLAYRLERWNPDKIIYVTDARQQLHFKQLFTIFGKWKPGDRPDLVHVWFGSILGENGKPFKTRSGETIRLSALLQEAEDRAFQIVTEKNPALDPDIRREVARIVGIGAVKYADLLPNRQSDYVFSWDKMLALQGNTAPYILYAYTRIRSIFRKHESLETSSDSKPPGPIQLETAEEIILAKHLLKFGFVLEAVAAECRPNYLCNFLFELAGHFARFFEQCPVLKADPAVRSSRLQLCDLTGQVIRQGLGVLGIETTDRM